MKTRKQNEQNFQEVKVENEAKVNVQPKEEAKETKTIKVKKVKKPETAKKNVVKKVKKPETAKKNVVKKVKKQAEVNLVEEVITKREVKYIYPADCQDTLSRKKHRQQVRNQLNRLELEMLRIEDKQSKEFKAKEKEYLKFKKANVKSA